MKGAKIGSGKDADVTSDDRAQVTLTTLKRSVRGLTSLPFASPGDPVTAARIDTINAKGGDAFGDYQVPLAILTLQQGLGRLIRHRTDRGVLAVLDPRLRTTGYGRRFLSALPPAPVTHDLDAISRFFR